jgi:fluoride exporter
MTSIYIGIAGILGALTRYACTLLWNPASPEKLPWGTLFCNLSGCLVLSFIAYSTFNQLPAQLRLVITTGFIGSYTTFSSFSFEVFALIDAGRVWLAVIYIMVSLWGGLLFAWLGYRIALVRSSRGAIS